MMFREDFVIHGHINSNFLFVFMCDENVSYKGVPSVILEERKNKIHAFNCC